MSHHKASHFHDPRRAARFHGRADGGDTSGGGINLPGCLFAIFLAAALLVGVVVATQIIGGAA